MHVYGSYTMLSREITMRYVKTSFVMSFEAAEKNWTLRVPVFFAVKDEYRGQRKIISTRARWNLTLRTSDDGYRIAV